MKIDKISFIVRGEPVGKGRPRFSKLTGKPYTDEKTREYEARVRFSFLQQSHGRFFIQKGDYADLTIKAFYGVAKSKTKTEKRLIASGKVYPDKKPDLDNDLKAIWDALNGVAYQDDAQIIHCEASKVYTFGEPHVLIDIRRIHMEDENV